MCVVSLVLANEGTGKIQKSLWNFQDYILRSSLNCVPSCICLYNVTSHVLTVLRILMPVYGFKQHDGGAPKETKNTRHIARQKAWFRERYFIENCMFYSCSCLFTSSSWKQASIADVLLYTASRAYAQITFFNRTTSKHEAWHCSVGNACGFLFLHQSSHSRIYIYWPKFRQLSPVLHPCCLSKDWKLHEKGCSISPWKKNNLGKYRNDELSLIRAELQFNGNQMALEDDMETFL